MDFATQLSRTLGVVATRPTFVARAISNDAKHVRDLNAIRDLRNPSSSYATKMLMVGNGWHVWVRAINGEYFDFYTERHVKDGALVNTDEFGVGQHWEFAVWNLSLPLRLISEAPHLKENEEDEDDEDDEDEDEDDEEEDEDEE